MDKPLYGILFPHQRAQIKEWCWGKCGLEQIGAVDIGPALVIICQQGDCPHLDKELGEPMGEIAGRPLFLRKLLDVDE